MLSANDYLFIALKSSRCYNPNINIKKKEDIFMSWELSVLHWFESIHNPVLDAIMKVITMFGDSGIFFIALSAIFIIFKKTRKMGIAMAISLVFSVVITNLTLKNLVDRARPFAVDPSFLEGMLVKLPTDPSFPSGHASACFAAATSSFFINKKWGIPFLILATLVAISRLYLTVHFPTDVIVGTIVGIISGIISALIAIKFIFKNKTSEA